MSKALRECPKSGVLWSEELLTCAKPLQKSRSIDALRACVDDPYVLIAVARLFERGGAIQKARRRFDRALALNPKLGDGWGYYYAMEYVQAYKSELIRSGMIGRAGPATASSNGAIATTAGNTSTTAATSAATTTTGKALSTKDMIQMFGGIDSVDDNEEDEETAEEKVISSGNASVSVGGSVGGNSISGVAKMYGGHGASPGSAAAASNTTSNITSNTNDITPSTDSATTTINTTDITTTTSERPTGYLLNLIALHVQNAEPNQGELWCATHKETKHRRLTSVQVLPVVVEHILGYAPVLHTISLPVVEKKV